ncbi:MAG: class I SAM-dependent methyltransferase [Chitinophagales bacterium]
MRLTPYLHYFFYIAWHWNPVLASFIIYHEIRGEKKYHIHTIGEDELKGLKKRGIDISHATMYMPVNYYMLDHLMREIIKYRDIEAFLDIGCGKGRVLVVASAYGFKEILGIDFSKEFCEEADATVQLYSKKNPASTFTITNIDAFYYEIPKNVATIFLFNPFDEVIMAKVVSNIIKSLERYPRTVRVLYANAQHKSLFLDKGFVEIYHFKKLNYSEGIILQREAGQQLMESGR